MTKPGDERPRGKNGLEWSVFAVSLVVVVGMFGVLVPAAATGSDEGARLQVSAGAGTAEAGTWHVPVTLENRGGVAAEHVVVSVQAGEEVGEIEFERVSRGGTVRGFVVFQHAPGAAPRALVKAYQTP